VINATNGKKVRKQVRKDREKLGDRDKRKGWFSRWRYGRSRRLCWRYKEQKQLHEALENELNKGLGGSGQNALEKMKEIENKY
jgi:hypothetical protein